MKRSLGVTIAALGLIGFSILRLKMTVTMIWASLFYSSWYKVPQEVIPLEVMGTLMGILILLVGLDLLHLKSWARKGIVYISLIGVIIGILFLLPLVPVNVVSKLLQLTFHSVYLYFFTRPKVKEQFEKQ